MDVGPSEAETFWTEFLRSLARRGFGGVKLGLAGVHVPEEYGGQGFSFVELGIVPEEMGRALLCASTQSFSR